jgi:hypothetical protein
VWQEIAGLVHQVDAQFVVFDGDVDVHATDGETAPDSLQVLGEDAIALPLSRALMAGARKGVRRCGHRREAAAGRNLTDRGAQAGKVPLGLAEGTADGRADLDLGSQKLRADAVAQPR